MDNKLPNVNKDKPVWRCVDWSTKIENDYGWADNLAIYIKSKEFVEWLEYFSNKE